MQKLGWNGLLMYNFQEKEISSNLDYDLINLCVMDLWPHGTAYCDKKHQCIDMYMPSNFKN